MIGGGGAWLPPIEEADAWVWGVYDEEDETGGIITQGRRPNLSMTRPKKAASRSEAAM